MNFLLVFHGEAGETSHVVNVRNKDDIKRELANDFVGELTEEDWAFVNGTADELLEDGHVTFEGDPPLSLIRVPEGVTVIGSKPVEKVS